MPKEGMHCGSDGDAEQLSAGMDRHHVLLAQPQGGWEHSWMQVCAGCSQRVDIGFDFKDLRKVFTWGEKKAASESCKRNNGDTERSTCKRLETLTLCFSAQVRQDPPEHMHSNVSLSVLFASDHSAGFLSYISSCFKTGPRLKNKRKGLQVHKIHYTVSIVVPIKSFFIPLLAVQIQAKYVPIKPINSGRSFQQHENKLLKNPAAKETQAGCSSVLWLHTSTHDDAWLSWWAAATEHNPYRK